MEHKKVLILIPSRYHSSRFEGKPLAPINGKSLVQWVYEGCESAKEVKPKNLSLSFHTYVVTDDDRIEEHVTSFGGNVLRVDDDVASGTLRIERALNRYFKEKEEFDVVINVQGDEPLIKGEDLVNLAEFQIISNFDISTIVKKEPLSNRDVENPDRVKCIFSEESGKCFFFTRAEFPYDRDRKHEGDWYLHLGVYAYSPLSLSDYCVLEPSRYEKLEKLEQLRAIENDMTIGAIMTEHEMFGVDRPEDVKKLEGVLSGK